MKRLWLTLAAVVLAAPVSADAQNLWVRGTVSAIAGDTVTIKAMDQDMTFTVTPKTSVVARGAGTAALAAEDEGKTGVKLADFVKVGERVEVHYTEAGGTMTATRIRIGVGSGDAKGGGGERGRATSGIVSAVDGTSLTVTVSGKEMKFALDGGTRFVGRGLGTKAAAAGGKLTPTDAVGKGDQVSVSYHDQAGSLRATEVQVLRRAGPPK
jgi:hypothetical protein